MILILNAMTKILVTVFIGFMLCKKKILDSEINTTISRMLSLVGAPCMVITAVLRLNSEKKSEVVQLLIIGTILYISVGILSFIYTRLLRPEKHMRGVYQALCMFGNTAFLGFPISEALMGNIGVSYFAVLNVFQTLGVWSFGVFLLTKSGNDEYKFSVKKIISPAIVASAIALTVFFLNIKVPALVMAPITFIGQITSPMAMIVIGSTIATYSLKALFVNWRYYFICAFKLVIVPTLVLLVTRMAIGSGDITRAVSLHMCMPPAVILSMIALTYKADSKTTSGVTGLATVMCMITIPLMWIFITALA